MNTWKIYNKTNSDVKVTIRIENTKVLGIFLKPKHFVIGMPSMTAQIDAQKRRNLIDIESDFDNSYFQFNLGEQYEQGMFEGLKRKQMDELKKIEHDKIISSLNRLK